MPCPLSVTALLLACASTPDAGDPRGAYDVLTYRLDLRVDPDQRRVEGVAYTRARVVAGPLEELVLDLDGGLEVEAAREVPGVLTARSSPLGRPVAHERDGDLVRVRLSPPRETGDVVCVSVVYGGSPRAVDGFAGVHWKHTRDGLAWVSASLQSTGSRYLWPGKDSSFHPEDAHEELYVNLTVPRGLVGVSNGRLAARSDAGDGWETFHWVHPYPCPTWSVTVNVGPFEEVARDLHLRGVDEPVPFVYWVLPEAREPARVQFEEVPELVSLFSDHFGPWPFPRSKIGIVHTSFWGMEHSSAIAYGSSFPAWREERGLPDPWAHRNRHFDYVLVHDLAHEWWGNAVSASDWGHLWIHEGFATYAESLLIETREGRAEADAFFERMRSWVAEDSRLYRGSGRTSEEAYGAVVYVKGAWLLHTLRHYLDDDATWWRALREFNLRHRYRGADTEDFRAVLEEVSGRSWERFFDEWFYGVGYPELEGEVRVDGREIVVDVTSPVRHETPFHVPLDLVWWSDGNRLEERVELGPGENLLRIPCGAEPREVEIEGLHRVLGKHAIRVR